MRMVKAILQNDIILPIQSPDLYKQFKLHLPRGILFYGPPGCGKTFIARKLAKILRFNFIEAKPSDLGSIYVHGGQEMIANLFSEARKKAPTIIFLDESATTTRGGGLRKAPGKGQRDGCVTDTNSNIEASRFSGKTISNDKNSNDQNIICAVLSEFLGDDLTLLFGTF
jgi:ATP-dependent Zn protease